MLFIQKRCGIGCLKYTRKWNVFEYNFSTSIMESVSVLADDLCVRYSSLSIIDAHNHIQLDPIYHQVDEVINQSIMHGIKKMAICGVRPGEDWDRVQLLYEKYPAVIVPQFGLHPWWIQEYLRIDPSNQEDQKFQLQSNICQDCNISSCECTCIELASNSSTTAINWEAKLEEMLQKNSFAGVGECGLDKAIKKQVTMNDQEIILRRHLEIARKYNRPVTIHCVNAWGKLLEILQDHFTNCDCHDSRNSVILHSCNSLPNDLVKPFIALDKVYFSFSCKQLGETQRNLLLNIPIDKLLVETDSPDQRPQECVVQSGINVPSNVIVGYEKISRFLSKPTEEIIHACSLNFLRIFS